MRRRGGARAGGQTLPLPPRGAAGPWSRREAWAWGTASLRPRSGCDAAVEAEILLRAAAGISREERLLRPDAPLGDAAANRYVTCIERRREGVPVAYLTGRREFFGIELAVDARALIPRPETERLVEAAAEHLGASTPRGGRERRVADIGTGSGAIAIALAVATPDARVLATDVSRDALAVARGNAVRAGVAGRIAFACGADLAPLADAPPAEGLDALLSNPPYIPAAEIAGLPVEVRDHEPRVALEGGRDGLLVHRAIIAGAARYLVPGGLLALEVAALWREAEAVAALIERTGAFARPRILRDHAGLDRVVAALRAA